MRSYTAVLGLGAIPYPQEKTRAKSKAHPLLERELDKTKDDSQQASRHDFSRIPSKSFTDY